MSTTASERALASADLVGTWRLERWDAVAADGSTTQPFGHAPLGYVVYTPDGRMITTISEADRPPIGGDLLSGPEAARLTAFASFIAYSGTFRVVGSDVIHAVEMSLFPDWIGGEQLRHVELDETRRKLTLSTDPTPTAGRVARHRLTWQRL